MLRADCQWWEDYGVEKGRLDDEWRDEHHPGQDIATLDTPGIHRLKARKFAHRMVARREGLEHLLPDDFDEIFGDEDELAKQEELLEMEADDE